MGSWCWREGCGPWGLPRLLRHLWFPNGARVPWWTMSCVASALPSRGEVVEGGAGGERLYQPSPRFEQAPSVGAVLGASLGRLGSGPWRAGARAGLEGKSTETRNAKRGAALGGLWAGKATDATNTLDP